jgi:hypothetical protein
MRSFTATHTLVFTEAKNAGVTKGANVQRRKCAVQRH